MSAATGDVVGGRYRLDHPIGRGGSATIWRAVHLDLNRPVAVKFLSIAGTDSTAVRERFLREARIAAAVRHRNVVDITDFGTGDDGRPFMVMELLEGESLAARMNRDPYFAIPDVIRIGARTLSGLGAVHDAGIVHRDLKPENVFLVEDADGRYPKLLDFGISRSLEEHLESVVPTHDNVLAGTPQYMSPEQARGVRDVDARADLWSVGVLLYEMLTGKLPYDDENPGDLIVKVLTEDPVPLERLRPDLSEHLATVVGRAMAKDRTQRFVSAREMRQALLAAATATAADMRRARVPSAYSSVSEHPALDTKELMDAVGSSYEPGDSAVISVMDAERAAAPTRIDETERIPPRAREEARKGRGAWWAVAAGALVAAAAIFILSRGGGAREAAIDIGLVAAAPADDTAERSMVTLRRLPAEAAVTVDGRPQTGPVVHVPRDGAEHVIEVNVPGFEPWHVTHSGDADVAHDVELVPLASGDRRREQPSGGPARTRADPDELIRDPGF